MTFTDLQTAIPELSPYQIDQISAQNFNHVHQCIWGEQMCNIH